jgi:UDP-N-acetyl-alpha-D-muramoyl-L-alanyl-L-glutamate epimerase
MDKQNVKLKVEKLDIFDKHIMMTHSLNDTHMFQTKVFYPNGELVELKKFYQENELRKLYCHIAFFEGFKFMMAFPHTYDITHIEDGLCQETLNYFNDVITKLYGQHIYENKRVEWIGPRIVFSAELASKFDSLKNPIELNCKNLVKDVHERPLLCSNGGGKDSLLAMKLVSQANKQFSVFTHARSEYGRHEFQLKLQNKLLKHVSDYKSKHEIIVFDDFTDGIFMQNYFPEIIGECVLGRPCQAGFPEMVFESLPFVLLNGYSFFVLGNERSANAAQALCAEMSVAVSHQFLKSYESEKRLGEFMRTFLVKDFSVFSILRPLHDYRIYKNISKWPEIMADIHSCNIDKPWCKECSKCAYVWCSLNSVYDTKLVHNVFKENLFDKECLYEYWQQLLGLTEHNAFECVGECAETRLAFKKCLEKGMTGKAIDLFVKSNIMETTNWAELEKKYGTVYENDILIPEQLFSALKTYF